MMSILAHRKLAAFFPALLILGTVLCPAPRAADAPAAGDSAPAEKKPDDLDVTITGEAKNEAPVEKAPPPMDVPFADVASFSREGQTEDVLAQPVEHMTDEERTQLVEIDSRQTVAPLPVRLPKAPFLQVEPPPNVLSSNWEFRVVDQENRVVREMPGDGPLPEILQWDGYEDNVFKLLAGPAYTPVLVITGTDGKKQPYFGDSVQFDALQYEQDGLLHLEFRNDRLYEKGGASFAKEFLPVLEASLDLMRQRVGTPFRVTLYSDPGAGAPVQKRLETWKKFLQKELMIEPDEITAVSAPMKDRGDVSTIMMLIHP